MWRKISLLSITLVGGLISSLHGMEVTMMRYAYQSSVVRPLIHDTYVICDGTACPQTAQLERMPVVLLSIRVKPEKRLKKRAKTLIVHFKLDSSKLLESEKKKLLLFAKEHAGEKVEVTGYTCWLGSKEHNQKLAEMRARAVADFLSKNSIQIVSAQGFGKCCYIDRENPAPNRRVEVKEIK